MSGTETIPKLEGATTFTTFFDGTYNAESVTITICCALALWNAIELLILVFITFRRYAGLYFWSLTIASSGVIPYVIGFMCEYFVLAPQLVGEIIATFGWPMMVTGQSLVLYSRLGVVLGPNYDRILKAVKWMIIVDAIVFHISTTVVMFGTYNAHPAREFALAYKYIEKIQMTGFTVQELIISGLYVWRTLDILKIEYNPDGRNRKRRQTMVELFAINALIIFFDIALLVVEYQNRHPLEQALKAVVYSTKLKSEFLVLNKLVNISQRYSRSSEDTFTIATTTDTERGVSLSTSATLTGSMSYPYPKGQDKQDALYLEKL